MSGQHRWAAFALNRIMGQSPSNEVTDAGDVAPTTAVDTNETRVTDLASLSEETLVAHLKVFLDTAFARITVS